MISLKLNFRSFPIYRVNPDFIKFLSKAKSYEETCFRPVAGRALTCNVVRTKFKTLAYLIQTRDLTSLARDLGRLFIALRLEIDGTKWNR